MYLVLGRNKGIVLLGVINARVGRSVHRDVMIGTYVWKEYEQCCCSSF